MLVEIVFLSSQFQCGPNAEHLEEFSVQIHNEKNLAYHTIELGEKKVWDMNDLSDLGFIEIINLTNNCSILPIQDMTLLYMDENSQVPNVGGYENQMSLQETLDTEVGNDPQYAIIAIEFGTVNQESSAFDLQDIVIKLDWNQERILNNIPAD